MRQPFVLFIRPQCLIYKAKCDRLPCFFHFLCSRRHTFIRPEVSSNLGRAHISISSSLNISVLKSMTVVKTIKMKSEKHYDIQFFKVLRTIPFLGPEKRFFCWFYSCSFLAHHLILAFLLFLFKCFTVIANISAYNDAFACVTL